MHHSFCQDKVLDGRLSETVARRCVYFMSTLPLTAASDKPLTKDMIALCLQCGGIRSTDHEMHRMRRLMVIVLFKDGSK